MKKLLPLILTAAALLAPSAAFADDLSRYSLDGVSNYSKSKFAQHNHLINSEGLPQLAGNKDSFLSSKGYENDAELFSYDLKIYSRLVCGTAHTKCISNLEAKSYKSRAQLLSTGNGDLIGTRVVTPNTHYNYTEPTPWLGSSAYWPAIRYCNSIYGRPHAFNNAQRSCVSEQKRLAGY